MHCAAIERCIQEAFKSGMNVNAAYLKVQTALEKLNDVLSTIEIQMLGDDNSEPATPPPSPTDHWIDTNTMDTSSEQMNPDYFELEQDIHMNVIDARAATIFSAVVSTTTQFVQLNKQHNYDEWDNSLRVVCNSANQLYHTVSEINTNTSAFSQLVAQLETTSDLTQHHLDWVSEQQNSLRKTKCSDFFYLIKTLQTSLLMNPDGLAASITQLEFAVRLLQMNRKLRSIIPHAEGTATLEQLSEFLFRTTLEYLRTMLAFHAELSRVMIAVVWLIKSASSTLRALEPILVVTTELQPSNDLSLDVVDYQLTNAFKNIGLVLTTKPLWSPIGNVSSWWLHPYSRITHSLSDLVTDGDYSPTSYQNRATATPEHTSIPDSTIPNDIAYSAPHSTTPNDTACLVPRSVTPNDTALRSATPNDTALRSDIPNDTALRSATPNDAALRSDTPNDTVPDDKVLRSPTPNNVMPDSTVNNATPHDAVPNDSEKSTTSSQYGSQQSFDCLDANYDELSSSLPPYIEPVTSSYTEFIIQLRCAIVRLHDAVVTDKPTDSGRPEFCKAQDFLDTLVTPEFSERSVLSKALTCLEDLCSKDTDVMFRVDDRRLRSLYSIKQTRDLIKLYRSQMRKDIPSDVTAALVNNQCEVTFRKMFIALKHAVAEINSKQAIVRYIGVLYHRLLAVPEYHKLWIDSSTASSNGIRPETTFLYDTITAIETMYTQVVCDLDNSVAAASTRLRIMSHTVDKYQPMWHLPANTVALRTAQDLISSRIVTHIRVGAVRVTNPTHWLLGSIMLNVAHPCVFTRQFESRVDKSTVRRSEHLLHSDMLDYDLVVAFGNCILHKEFDGVQTDLVAEPHKLVKYDEGDYEILHTDNQNSSGYATSESTITHTLIVRLYSEERCVGGDLRCTTTGEFVPRYFHNQEYPIAYTLIDTNTPYEVTPVTVGFQYTLLYRVHTISKSALRTLLDSFNFSWNTPISLSMITTASRNQPSGFWPRRLNVTLPLFALLCAHRLPIANSVTGTATAFTPHSIIRNQSQESSVYRVVRVVTSGETMTAIKDGGLYVRGTYQNSFSTDEHLCYTIHYQEKPFALPEVKKCRYPFLTKPMTLPVNLPTNTIILYQNMELLRKLLTHNNIPHVPVFFYRNPKRVASVYKNAVCWEKNEHLLNGPWYVVHGVIPIDGTTYRFRLNFTRRYKQSSLFMKRRITLSAGVLINASRKSNPINYDRDNDRNVNESTSNGNDPNNNNLYDPNSNNLDDPNSNNLDDPNSNNLYDPHNNNLYDPHNNNLEYNNNDLSDEDDPSSASEYEYDSDTEDSIHYVE